MSDKPLEPLLPVRHTQPDLFSIDVSSISIKDSHQHLEHPFFVLDPRPDTAIRNYEDPLGNTIEIHPGPLGMPTIYDKDTLIYAISHIMHRRNRGEPTSRRVVVYSADLLRFANRTLGGKDYVALEKSLLRLRSCTIRTSIRTGDVVDTRIFGFIDSADLQRKYDTKGRLMHCEITLSEWLWRAIEAHEILTLHPDYFRIRRPIERRLYEIARKHCGIQPSWSISTTRLYEKCAIKSPLLYFRCQMRKIAVTNALPEYRFEHCRETDRIHFYRRDQAQFAADSDSLDPETFRLAQQLAPNDDIASFHRQWMSWREKGNLPPPRFHRQAFLGFVRQAVKSREDAVATGEPLPRPGTDTIDPKLLAWWNGLPEERRIALEEAHRIVRTGSIEFPRSDKQLIEYSARVGLPQSLQ